MMFLERRSPSVKNAPPVSEAGPQQSPLPTTAEEVYGTYAPRVYSLARRLLSNDSDAEDVTQDVLLQVVRKLNTFRSEAGLTTWLHCVTINAALLARRKQSAHPPLDVPSQGDRLSPTRSAAPEQGVRDHQMQELIEAAIARLPEIYRDVYVLSDVEGLASAEIGAILGLAVLPVKSRLHRARLMMHAALTSHV